MLSIKTNLMSQNAARHLGKNYDRLGTSVSRLASGLRINGSRDDAAGLAVRELIRADVARLDQGARNAQDAISMLQTAEGAMGVIDEILVRMEELAEQAATESYSGDQRTIMNNEFQLLADEITRIAQDTSFNGITLLDTTSTYKIQVGAADPTASIDVAGAKMDAEALGVGGTVSTATLNKNYASAGATVATTAGGTVNFTWATGANFTVTATANMTVTEVADAINAASRGSDDYEAAEVRVDSDTGAATLFVKNNVAGAHALTVTGNAGAADLDNANWNKMNGSGAALSIATAADARTALTTVTNAIKTKDIYRAKLGYWMNRLDAATDVATLASENLSAAESRISDVDVATEMANMTKTQVLAQAGIAMLSQANQMPQMALKLLG